MDGVKRVIIIEEHEMGWDSFIRYLDDDKVGHPRRRWKTYEEAEAHAKGMLDGISFHTEEIVSHGLIYERMDDK
jgi:hypothetical protein